jgi:hypothetical protein
VTLLAASFAGAFLAGLGGVLAWKLLVRPMLCRLGMLSGSE